MKIAQIQVYEDGKKEVNLQVLIRGFEGVASIVIGNKYMFTVNLDELLNLCKEIKEIADEQMGKIDKEPVPITPTTIKKKIEGIKKPKEKEIDEEW